MRDPNRLVMQTPLEALAEAREEILALLKENKELQEEIRRLRSGALNGGADRGERGAGRI